MPSPARQRPSTPSAARHHPARGFTLVELLVTMGILAILIGLAVPSFRGQIISNRITSHANELIASLQIARSEAIRNNARVVMCASTDASTCTGGPNWTIGWIVFVDADRNGNLNGAETVLRSGTIRPGTLILNSAAIGNTGSVTFRSDGLAYQGSGPALTTNLLTARIGVCEPVNAAAPNPLNNVRHVSTGSGSRFAIIRVSVPTCAGAPPD